MSVSGGTLEGKLVKGLGGLYEVFLPDGRRIGCRGKGAFRHENTKLCIGDDVTVSDEGGYVITGIRKRQNLLIRPPISNIGVIFITFSCTEPEPLLLNIDKLTCIAGHTGIRPVITVTKADLAPEKARALADIYDRVGYRTFITESGGSPDEIRAYIRTECRNTTSCFAGASGVGKSTLMSSLFPGLELETGEISKKIARGRNTTRHVELYPLGELFGDGEGGFLADTPGFSLIDFVHFDFFDKEALPGTFPEFEPYLGKCRYTRCTHLCEDGCAICDAVRNGTIPGSRHDSFVSLYHDLKNKHKWDKQ